MFESLRRHAPGDGLQFDPSSVLGLANVSPNLFAIAVDGRFVVANPVAESFLCAGAHGALHGRSVLELIHADDRARTRELIDRVRATGQAPVLAGVRLLAVDGRPVELEVSATPVAFNGEQALMFVGRDASEARRANAALVESERRYQSLAAAAPVAIFRLDAEGRCVYLNKRWSELTGIPIDEALGRSWLEFVTARGKSLADKVWQVLVTQPGEYRAEHKIDHRNGSSLDALTQVAPETDAEGRVVGYVGTSTDLSDLKAAERALAYSEERLRFALQASSMVSWEADLDTGRVEWSEGAHAVLGLPEGVLPSAIDQGLSLVRPERVTFRSGSARESIESGEPFEIELRITPQGAAPRWILTRGQAKTGGADEGRRIVGVIADVTARREFEAERAALEQKLVEAQRLESLGLLAGGVAHDFNNLLVGILGNAELALARLRADAASRALVEGIRDAGMRAAELAHQILAYSGRKPMMRQSIDLEELVRGTLGLLRASLPANVSIRIDAPDRLALVEGDPTQLRQVLMNLLINAGESLSKDGGDVRVTLAHVDAGAAQGTAPLGWLALDVVDSGAGMDAQTRARIFDPFFTTHATGRGLGLAVVHGIVRAHGGSIEVESEPGSGTRMRVLLPAAPAAACIRATPEAASEVAEVPSALVLVVDDERAVREVVRLSLESAGHRVLLAANTGEARALLEAHAGAIDAVVLDLTLGSDSSERVLEEIRARSPNVPVLVTSGYPEEQAIGRLAALGVSAFVQKPFTPARLVAGIAGALAKCGAREDG